MKRLIVSALVALAAVATQAKTIAGLEVSDAVTPGVWCSDLSAAKEYADANGVPMLVFYANPGCGFCEKLESACKKDDFLEWQTTRGYVMVFAYGTSSVANWILKIRRLSNLPLIAMYWNGTAKAFSGRSGSMPVTGGSLQSQLMQSMDEFAAGWTGGGTVQPVEPQPVEPQPVEPQPKEPQPTLGEFGAFHPAKAYKAVAPYVGTISGPDGFTGIIQLSVGKEKKGYSKVSAVINWIDGKKYSAKSVNIPCGDDASAKWSTKLGTLSISIGNKGFSGTLGGSYDVEMADIDSQMTSGTYVFSMVDLIDIDLEDYMIIDETVPTDYTVAFDGKKFNCGKAPSIKYKKDRELDSYELVGLDDENKPNCPGLKLTYTKKTGAFKGSFKVLMAKDDGEKKPKIKKYSASVNGMMFGSEGIGVVTIKKVGTFACTLSRE